MEDDETLLIQSGKPVGVFRTNKGAPRVLIANSNLVPHWANWEHFNELDRKGLMMFGQMTAGSWIYIGSQGIIQGTYETFVSMARKHLGGDLTGKWILTAGLGGMGGAQPLAAKFAGASMLAIECRESRIQKRLDTGYIDVKANSLEHGLELIRTACAKGEALTVGVVGNAAEIYPKLVRDGVRPDAVTDQTSAHDPLNGYLPAGWTVEEWEAKQKTDEAGVMLAAPQIHGAPRAGHARFPEDGHSHLRLRQQHPPGSLQHGPGKRLRLPRLRARLCPRPVLHRPRSVPLGGALR